MHQLRKHETSQHSSDLTLMHLTAGCKKVSGSLLNGTMEYGDRRGCVAWCGALGHEAMAWSKPCHCMMLCTRRIYAPIGVHTQGWFHPWSFAVHRRGSRTPSLGTRLDPTMPQQLLLPCHAAPATRKANPVLNRAAGPHWSEYLVVTRDQKEQLRRQQTTCIYIYLIWETAHMY